jgi:hypothetical protein
MITPSLFPLKLFRRRPLGPPLFCICACICLALDNSHLAHLAFYSCKSCSCFRPSKTFLVSAHGTTPYLTGGRGGVTSTLKKTNHSLRFSGQSVTTPPLGVWRNPKLPFCWRLKFFPASGFGGMGGAKPVSHFEN